MKIIRGQNLSTTQAMTLAIAEARRGRFRVSPNPPVGCVILDSQGQFLSKGHHEFFGGPHAEIMALEGLTLDELRGAHLFVTLEPCAHEGKTPSCAKRLAQLPLSRVTYGLRDPNPLVSGQGAEIIRNAGIQVELYSELQSESQSDLQTDLEEICEAFLWNFNQKKIFVSLKLATSLDGVMALESGESKWITNEKSRNCSHELRGASDAILIGAGTLAKDNPRLNIRLKPPKIPSSFEKTPLNKKLIILDTRGDLLKRFQDFEISKLHRPENIFWCVSSKAAIPKGASPSGLNLVQIAERGSPEGGDLSLEEVLAQLWNHGLRSVFVEGGAKVASHFLENNLVNRLYLFMAPLVLGTQGGMSWTSSLHTASMASRRELHQVRFKTFDQDILITGRLNP